MRILMCTNAYPPRFIGGAELVAHEQARILVSKGHDVVVFAGDLGGAGPRYNLAIDTLDGVTVNRVTTDPEDYDPSYLNFLHPEVDDHFTDLLVRFAPEVVHCHNLIGLSARIPMIAKEHGFPVLGTLHDYWGFCLRNTMLRLDGSACTDTSVCRICLPNTDLPLRLRKDFIELALDHVDLFIAPSTHLAEQYVSAGTARDRIRVAPNGIDVERFSPSPDGQWHQPVRLGYVGHLGEHKGVDILLDALPLLQARHDVRLIVAGQGPAEEAYRERLVDNGMSEQVEFCGHVPPEAMPELYRAMNILVVPSRWGENQPVCIMEAMASGLPVIASRQGGIPELVADGENGLLFASGDASDLARAAMTLIDDPAAAMAMGARGRENILRQTYKQQVEDHLQLFRQLQEQNTPARVRKKILGIAGQYRTLLRAKDHKMLSEEKRHRKYLVPLEWLTSQQRQKLKRLRYVKENVDWHKKAQRWFSSLLTLR